MKKYILLVFVFFTLKDSWGQGYGAQINYNASRIQVSNSIAKTAIDKAILDKNEDIRKGMEEIRELRGKILLYHQAFNKALMTVSTLVKEGQQVKQIYRYSGLLINEWEELFWMAESIYDSKEEETFYMDGNGQIHSVGVTVIKTYFLVAPTQAYINHMKNSLKKLVQQLEAFVILNKEEIGGGQTPGESVTVSLNLGDLGNILNTGKNVMTNFARTRLATFILKEVYYMYLVTNGLKMRYARFKLDREFRNLPIVRMINQDRQIINRVITNFNNL